MMVFNNLCLLYVQVSFYQVARALTVIFNVVFSWYILGTSTSRTALRACAVVVLGFLIGCFGEAYFKWEGIIYGVMSSTFVALYSVYVKNALSVVEGNQWKLMMYTTTLSVFFMIPPIFAFGEEEILQAHPNSYHQNFWFMLTLTGIFGFLINIAIYLQIKHTSPLIHNISGTAKACMQTLLAGLWLHNFITPLSALGIVLVIVGSFWYSQIRNAEALQETKPKEETA